MFYIYLRVIEKNSKAKKNEKARRVDSKGTFIFSPLLSYDFKDYSQFSKFCVCRQRQMAQGN